jgi:N-acyl-D-aspartate/D-glutamate deacylase
MKAAYELIIRNGTIADGRGGDPYRADVAINGGRIAAVGPDLAGSGHEEIRADDLLVTPGFVDIHTHYDGQVTWEETLTPSSQNGVTTVIMSNCAVGFAPCKPEHRELLIKLMEGVEDIPDVVMTAGIPWEWETFPEYLDFLAARRYDADIGVQVPHSPVRVYAMGQRAADREPANPNEMRLMAQLVSEAISAGALGFTTARTIQHRTRAGALTPTVTAAEGELRTIALGMRAIGKGVIQAVDDFDDAWEDDSANFGMWRRILEASRRPLSVVLVELMWDAERWRRTLGFIEQCNRDGFAMRGQVSPRSIASLFGLSGSNHPFAACPSYLPLADLPLPERVARMRRPDVRAAILAEIPEDHVQQAFRQGLRMIDEMYEYTDGFSYEPAAGLMLGARAAGLGITSRELAYDIMLKDEGRALLYCTHGNYAHRNLNSTYERLKHPATVVGLGDGGAHVARLCDASNPTFILSYWTRDRAGDRFTIGEAVKMLGADAAHAVGLDDRGVIDIGYRADLNVIDYAALRSRRPYIEQDLPSNGKRFKQPADGYRATIVNGVVTFRDGAPTGTLPGRLIRGAQPVPA